MKYSDDNAQAIKKLLVATVIAEQAILELKDSSHNEVKLLGNRVIQASRKLQSHFLYHKNTDERYRELFRRQFLSGEIVLFGQILSTIQNLTEDSLDHVAGALHTYVQQAEEVQVQESGEILKSEI